MKAYAVQIRKGKYLTETLGTTEDINNCWWFVDKGLAELYLPDNDKYSCVIEIYIKEEQGQWVAYKE